MGVKTKVQLWLFFSLTANYLNASEGRADGLKKPMLGLDKNISP